MTKKQGQDVGESTPFPSSYLVPQSPPFALNVSCGCRLRKADGGRPSKGSLILLLDGFTRQMFKNDTTCIRRSLTNKLDNRRTICVLIITVTFFLEE